jgi:hypothetical protein
MEGHQRRAEAAAVDEPCRTHVAVDRLLLDHLKGYMQMREAEFDGRYADCVPALDQMEQCRRKLHAISPFLAMPPVETGIERYYSGETYFGLVQRRQYFKDLAAKIAGEQGQLVAMAPRAARFALDEAAVGKDLGWADPAFDRSSWRQIDTTRPFYLQGFMSDSGIPYAGHMWYVFEVDVPEQFRGRPIRVYSPFVTCQAWAWVNGRYAGARKYLEAYISPAPLDLDVTALVEPGTKNTIAVWVYTGTNRTQAPEGFLGRLFLWSPNEAEKKKAE